MNTNRKRSTNEIRTPDWVVKKMVDYIEPIKLSATYLESCCWGAPFLMEILKRKLKLCKDYDDILTAYKTIYGYELHYDNLCEGRKNLKSFYPDDINISIIVNTNLVQGDGLKNDFKLYDWEKGEWSKLGE